MTNGKHANKFMKGFLTIIAAGCLVACVLFAKQNLSFLNKGFMDNSKFFSLNGDYHRYYDVERVYYKENRVNITGETLQIPSYVLVLKNGKEFDFYEYAETGTYEPLLDFLREQGVIIER